MQTCYCSTFVAPIDSSFPGTILPSLRSFLDTLPAGELMTVREAVTSDYFKTALALECDARKRSPVLRFEPANGAGTPIVTNLFADRERIARMAGTTRARFNEVFARSLQVLLPPVVVDGGPVHEHVSVGDEVDVRTLPISRHFEGDAGRYISSGILVCKDPDTGVRNLSFQRLQVKGPNRFGASLHSRGHIWEHLQRCEARGRNLEVAVVIGCHPAIYLAAAAKVAMEVDEYEIAGSLMSAPVELVKCKTIDVEVPADAEYVLEGEILVNVQEDEGPFGEYTGYSTSRSTRNVFVVKAVTHRERPIYLDIVPGYSNEHLLLGRSAKEAFVFSRLKELVPNAAAQERGGAGAARAHAAARSGQLPQARRSRRRGRRRVPGRRGLVGNGDALSGRHGHVHGAKGILQPA
jgi:2,5-furandicarboxylate decarboxylase 1